MSELQAELKTKEEELEMSRRGKLPLLFDPRISFVLFFTG